MPHTVTLTDEQHENALRAVLRTLCDQLDDASEQIETLLAPNATPTDDPGSADASNMLEAARRSMEALAGLGWPGTVDREQAR